MKSPVVVLAIGMNREDQRQMLGIELANWESRPNWQ
jgi:transposase-like protein